MTLFASFTTSTGHFDQLILGAPFSLHGFPAPFRRRFPALPCGVIAMYSMQTVMRFSRFVLRFCNKKSPHNNLNLTVPSGMALVRIRYVAISLWGVLFRYFQRQSALLEQAVQQIQSCLDGNPDARLDCDREGEFYRLFHSVNALAAVLSAHADNEQREKRF